MHVTALVDGSLMEAMAHVTAVDPSQINLVLTCSDSVTRGSVATCVASGYPASVKPTVNSWTFESPDPLISTIPRVGEAAQQLQWSGEMAASGTVTVEGVVRGKAATKQATIAVNSRVDWAHRPPAAYQAREVPQYSLDTTPHAMNQLGKTVYRGAVSPTGMLDGPLDQSLYHTILDGGPNESVAYMVNTHTEVFDIEINTYAMKSGSTFWAAQPAVQTGSTCSQSYMLSQVSNVRKHEGTAMDWHSHTWWYKATLDTIDVGSKVEQVVNVSSISAKQLNDAIQSETTAAALEANRQADILNNNWTMPCTFNFTY